MHIIDYIWLLSSLLSLLSFIIIIIITVIIVFIIINIVIHQCRSIQITLRRLHLIVHTLQVWGILILWLGDDWSEINRLQNEWIEYFLFFRFLEKLKYSTRNFVFYQKKPTKKPHNFLEPFFSHGPYTKNVDQETMKKRKKTLIWSKIHENVFLRLSFFRRFSNIVHPPGTNFWKTTKKRRFFTFFYVSWFTFLGRHFSYMGDVIHRSVLVETYKQSKNMNRTVRAVVRSYVKCCWGQVHDTKCKWTS